MSKYKIKEKKYKCKLLPFEKIECLSIQDAIQKSGWGISAFDLPKAWQHTQGEGVIIAVIDSGCDLDHPDLKNNLVDGFNFIKRYQLPEDDNCHGTHCSGILVAENNDIGVVGVCPKAKVMPIKVLNKQGIGSLLDVAEGIKWAVDHGANIITMSLGSPTKTQEVRKAIQYAVNKGIPVFVAAGNAGNTKELFYPANYPETIAIGAINKDFHRAKFSNTGLELDFMAPGVDIFSTVPDNWYATLSGTCLGKGTYIYTPLGPKTIENIKPGDIVHSFNDGVIVEREVLFNIYRGKNDLYKIFAAGRTITATHTHKLLTINIKNKEVEWVEVQNLTENHKLLLPKKFKKTKNEYLNNLLNHDYCWMLGFFLGDGWISYTKRGMRIQFARGIYPDLLEKISTIYNKTTGKLLKMNKKGTWDYDDNTKVAMIIDCLGINRYAKDKTIPQWLWSLEDAKIESFLDGYLQADGWELPCKKGKRFGAESVSKDLIERFTILADYMGWPHSRVLTRERFLQPPNSKKPRYIRSSSTTIAINKPYFGWYPWRQNRHEETIRKELGLNPDDFFIAKWDKKEYTNDDVYDLTVPNADCFIANGIIAHNSMACPFATGVAALLLSYSKKEKSNINLKTVDDFRTLLKKYTTPIVDENYKNKNFYEGFGIIDPRKMLEFLKSKNIKHL